MQRIALFGNAHLDSLLCGGSVTARSDRDRLRLLARV